MLNIDPSSIQDCSELRENYQWLNRTRKTATRISAVAITTTVSTCIAGFFYGMWEFIKIISRK
jgi:hypothetical protein